MKPSNTVSETMRKNTLEWYDNTLLSRLNNKETGCIIIVMQRLHQDDLIAHVLEQEQWKILFRFLRSQRRKRGPYHREPVGPADLAAITRRSAQS